MKLLFVCENYWPMVGGAEHASQMLCEGMVARGHDVTVVAHLPDGAPLNENRNGVAIRRVSSGRSRYAFSLLSIPTICRLARSVDLIHTATFSAAPPSFVGSRLAHKPVLVTVWETWLGRWRQNTTFSPIKALIHETLERAIFALPYDRYAGISRATSTRLAEVLPRRRDRLETIYLGFDPGPWQAPVDRERIRTDLGMSGAFIVVGYGRPGISKGFPYLVRAVPSITRAIPNAQFILILSEAPQYRADLGRLKADAPKNVRFLPSQPLHRLVEIVKSADCAIVPSISEGFGYSTLEACYAGVPVVATEATSIPEVIGGTYRFARPRDAKSIADAVIAMHEGNAETSPLRSFPWESTLDAYEALYAGMIRAR